MTTLNYFPKELPQAHLGWKNPYAEMIRDGDFPGVDRLFFAEKLNHQRGKWLDTFENNPRKLYLEIGSHLGKTLVELAQENQDKAFLGSDITYKRCVTSANRLAAKSLQNAKVAMGDMKFVRKYFSEAELDGVMIFFPDPWSKKSQVKNRLIQKEFAEQLVYVLKNNGFVWLKMDQVDYFDQSREVFAAAGFEFIDMSLARQNILDIELLKPTTFERKFKQLGRKTYEACWVYKKR